VGILYKHGITAPGPGAQRALAAEAARRGWWPFAYTLLESIGPAYRAADEPLLERLYQSMAGGEGVFKITRRHRFRDLDERLTQELTGRFAGADQLTLHDMAASNGITSLDLFRRLSKDRTVTVHATDYFDALWMVDLPGERWTVVFDVDRRPLQVVGSGFVISCRQPPPLRYPVNRMLRTWLMKRVVPSAQARLTYGAEPDGPGGVGMAAGVRRVPLFHPECVIEARSERGFHLGRHDMFQPNPHPCQVVRILNALTPAHFSPDRVTAGIRAGATNLARGGLLILGRSPEDDSRTRATAFEWTGETLATVWELNGGYEWPELVPFRQSSGRG
jgi:hypothetical protein